MDDLKSLLLVGKQFFRGELGKEVYLAGFVMFLISLGDSLGKMLLLPNGIFFMLVPVFFETAGALWCWKRFEIKAFPKQNVEEVKKLDGNPAGN